MANPKLTISTRLLNDAMGSNKVRAALRAKANRVLPRAKAIAYSVGATEFAKALKVRDGTRPGTRSPSGFKRPYARVVAAVTPELKKKDGRTSLSRQQILRRGSSG